MSVRAKLAAAWRPVVTGVSAIGSVASIVAAVALFWGASGREGRLGLIFLFLIAVFFIGFSIFQAYRYARKARYAEAAQYFQAALQVCQDALEMEKIDASGLKEQARRVCDHLASAFSLITGTKCAACIKVIVGDLDRVGTAEFRVAVSTLVRDTTSSARNTDTVTHWLDANTDFEEVLSSTGSTIRKPFFENDLPIRRDYRNTSFEVAKPVVEPGGGFFANRRRRKTWTLPYQSTIVAAIQPSGLSGSPRLLGFLCVDSAARGAFLSRYDEGWVAAVAVAVHGLVAKWLKVTPGDLGSDAT